MDPNLTFLLICMAVLATACYAIHRLSSTPAKVAAVILAVATLVGALKPVGALLTGAQQPKVETVAPAPPAAASAAAPSASSMDVAAGGGL
ncbi:hypothetical protein [Streptomyces paradoxus]|uniref:hypothetical protein n=1 Tax=Streptomyces paradoxus TaxID=66375 RepID=UPI0036EB731F